MRQFGSRQTRRTQQTWQLVAGSAVVGLAVAAGAVTAAGPWDSGQRTAERGRAAAQELARGGHHDVAPLPRPAPSAAEVLAPLESGSDGSDSSADRPDPGSTGDPMRSRSAETDAIPPPTAPGLADALAPLLKAPALGPVRTASVVDAATGGELFGARQDEAATPASTIKLATAVAALSALGPDHRIDTTVVSAPGEKREIILVGAGDPTLTAHADAEGAADLRALADDTARKLKKRGATKVKLGYDASLYSGPAVHPLGPNENLAPVSALMADEARLDDSGHGPAARAEKPAPSAAHSFADLLRDRGIKIKSDPSPQRPPKDARRLARTRSLPLSALVERMLTHSDNDIAEALARRTAIATGHPASFSGAGKAVRKQLKKLRLPLDGARFEDGSGLNRADKAPASLLTQLLARAADPDHPELRPILTGLPVAGFSGTLRDRYRDKDSVGVGVVRAKTGTLTGVNTLAGTVVDADGRLLVFAFMTNGTSDPHGAQQALDRMASAVANCGCR
ncbi:D-alanyl-D-alanine carboxypeptidase/D-alanyl-D-alanine endopeptidase [Streptomyces sp. H27-D2]|uniref:D-alanyl-D-alanine carboxypeptidase/D-alanyl-D-alanine endopeptidase n=1 Tax=Streptomyces sp. H27-D2 TaxID=3046304 RepID=UPI002DBC392D|nr:D-alanyl-D-alanine carboxypeptidase/D-alanyl-D-alanine-endopeptidase [Streptomyces sp. H27-D2]MEC4016900.1 D-alanyl-D-alanine carboxypeptidase/D-alanyl-D-alanine-endopeptidase [Streptomyces sp. H27-D2]